MYCDILITDNLLHFRTYYKLKTKRAIHMQKFRRDFAYRTEFHAGVPLLTTRFETLYIRLHCWCGPMTICIPVDMMCHAWLVVIGPSCQGCVARQSTQATYTSVFGTSLRLVTSNGDVGSKKTTDQSGIILRSQAWRVTHTLTAWCV